MGRSLFAITPTGNRIDGFNVSSSYGYVHNHRAIVTCLAALLPLVWEDPDLFLAPEQSFYGPSLPGHDLLDFAESFLELELPPADSAHNKIEIRKTLMDTLDKALTEGMDVCYEAIDRPNETTRSPLRAALETFCSTPDHQGFWSIGNVVDLSILFRTLTDVYSKAPAILENLDIIEDHIAEWADFFDEVKAQGAWVQTV